MRVDDIGVDQVVQIAVIFAVELLPRNAGLALHPLLVQDQLLLGNELMIAPVYKQNAKGRYVYLPEQMMMVRMRKHDDYETEIMPKGHHYIKADLDEVVFFIRNGKAIPMGEPVNNTSELKADTYKLDGENLLGFEGATYSLYEDDGISTFDESRVSVRELTN